MSTDVNYNMVTTVSDTNFIAVTETLRIPLSEIEFRFSPSRGPGGQHVNRAHTRVTLLFDVVNSSGLDEPIREKLLEVLSSRLDSNGILHISAQDSRSQNRNRQLAIGRFVALLNGALEERPERIATKPSREANRKRLDDKGKRSKKKHERSQDWSKET